MQRSLSRLFSGPCFVGFLLVPTLMAATPGPAGYWSLNTSDIAATLALDRSGNHMDATVYNAGSVTGKIGQALNFNGVDAHLLLSNEAALMQLTGDLTIAAWIRTTNAVRDEAVVSKYDSTGAESGYIFKVTSSGTMALRLGSGNLASGPRETSDTTPINDGQWHHVAVVITLGQDVRFYVDGSLSSASPTVAAAGITASPTVFGYSGHAAYGEHFTGSLDEVIIFRKALAEAEIQPLSSNPQEYDLSAKSMAHALPKAAQLSPGSAVLDTTVSDFSAGVGVNTYIAQEADGEVMLAPLFGTEWSGNALPPNWSTTIWQSGGNATVANGQLALHAAMVGGATYGPNRSIEFVATFTADPDQHIGFGVDLLSPPWAIFSTQSNKAINIRTHDQNNAINQVIGTAYLGSPHLYRIDWTSTGFTYWIDGVQVGTHAIPIGSGMSPVLSNNYLVNQLLTSDWMHLTPYASNATFTSRVLDAGGAVRWSSATWTAAIPLGTSLAMSYRTGNTTTPDGTWTGFAPISGPGAAITGNSRYIQYQAALATSDLNQTVLLQDVTLQYTATLTNIQVSNLTPTAATFTWTSSTPADSQVDYGTTASYGFSSTLAPALVTNHSVSVSGLTANTLYHYRVKSNDGTGLVTSGDFTFTTPSVPDTIPPTVSITTPVAGQTVAGQVSIGASASDNVGVVGVQFAIDGSSLNAEVTSPPYSTTWDTTAVSNGTHTISAVARDAAGNHTTSAIVSVTVSNPTTRSLVDTTVADFAAGTGTNTYLSMTADGEVMQAPAIGLEFSSLPQNWSAAPWSTGGGVSLSGGKLNVDGALYMPGTYYGPGASLTFVATFSGDASQHIGFGTDLQGAPWAIFSTFGGGTLYVRTNSGTQSLATLVPGNNLGAPHLFRIDWQANGFIYWVDNVQVASHLTPIGTSMRPLLSDAFPGAGVISVDWLRMSPYATPATFVSRVMDAGAQASWSTLTWTADTPSGTSVAMGVRNGNTSVPDASWTAFRAITSGSSVGYSSRYLQYQAVLSSNTPVLSAALRDVTVQYDSSISNVQATNVTTSGATITWTTNTPSTSQVDYGTTIGYGSSTPLNSTLLTSHSVSLTGLQSGTAYHYRVESSNGSTLTISGDFTFQTAAIPDTTPPVVSMTAPAPGTVGGTVTVSANASDNVAVVGVQFLLDSSNLGAEVTTPPYSIAWNSTLTANGPHTLSATARDAAGNRTTASAVSVTVMNNGLLTMTDTTAADFAAGSGTNTYISITGNGEVIQAPAVGAEFATFPQGWTSAPWSAGGSSLVNGGKMAVDGALLYYGSSFGPGRSLEFVATFTGDASQHAGFGTDFQSAPWAIFSTWGGGATLYARSYSGSQSSATALPGSYIGAPHKYRIDWTTSGFIYSIDGAQVLNDPVPIAASMRPLVSDAIPGGGAVTLDWLRMSPYASSATFTSRVLDAGASVNWSTLAWSSTLPAGTGLALSVRSGNTPVPDKSWTNFSPVTSSGGSIGGSSRYIQYQAQLTTNNPAQTAALNDVTISYTP